MHRVAVVADDHELFRSALSAVLKSRLGFADVIETASLDEALERLGDVRATLALFDLNMPGMATASSLLAVRECYPGVRVAVVSASERRRDILLALEAGVHGYVPKALPVDAIADALRTVLDGSIFVPPSLADVGRPGEPVPVTPEPTGSAAVSLTPRQRDVLDLLMQGKSNKEIARALTLGEGTIKVHMAALFRTLGVQNRSAAAVIGERLRGAG